MTITLQMVLLVLGSYLIGNISPSILLAKRKNLDIRTKGSGNAGTTNALRVLGKKAAVITLIVDILKGTSAVLVAGYIGGEFIAELCVVAVFMGHVWPIFFGFKGGKGVATAFGALMGLNPVLGLSALGIVVLGVILSRRMSVGSILGALTFPVLAYFLQPTFVIQGCILAVILIFKHRGNVVRLIKGEEPKLFDKDKKSKYNKK